MSGWWDDWASGKVDGYTAFFSWLDGELSPSEVADERCGYARPENQQCRNEAEQETIDRLTI